MNNRTIWQNPIHFIAFGFGSGLLPKIPGTWGTLAAIPIYLLLAHLPLSMYLLSLLGLILFGIWCCDYTNRALPINDHPGIVFDEILGYLLVMTAIPVKWHWIVSGFLLFRLFDILKPWPIRLVDQHYKNGFGIVLDDLLAAIPAWAILFISSHY